MSCAVFIQTEQVVLSEIIGIWSRESFRGIYWSSAHKTIYSDISVLKLINTLTDVSYIWVMLKIYEESVTCFMGHDIIYLLACFIDFLCKIVIYEEYVTLLW